MQQATADLEDLTDRAKQAVTEYNAMTAALPGAQAALAEARGAVVGAQSAARQAEREAAAARAAAEEAARQFQAASAEVDRARDDIAGFVAAAYKGNSVAMFNAILDSQSPTDLIDSIGYLQRMAADRRAALDDFVAGRMYARQRSDLADAARDRASKAEETAQRALAQAVVHEQAAEQAAATLQATLRKQAAAIAVAESERGAVLARYNSLKAQSARLAASLRQVARTHVGTYDSGAGAMRWPVSGRLSSPYGMRIHPVYGYPRMHTGIDLAAPGGTPIYAAASGTVVEAGEHGGYGKFTCIYHGKHKGQGLSSCYAHQSVIGVRVGQKVQRGDVIGWVGTTGVSTGDHLHFEVRLDGEAVDPMGWLP
ncbi:MAG: M23 family metallopeptidase [Micromonosporaceae bacterium]|nr:M23 family metallopeptidase [Micromonosporaceae bacterium]